MGGLFSRSFLPNSKYPGQTYRCIDVAIALGYDRHDVDVMFRYFSSLDVSNEGLVSTREFVIVNKISCEKYGEMIFQVFDKYDVGNVTFERFLVAMWNILVSTNLRAVFFFF
jgi:Ca2+-binding EF-hand superfamily protein